MPRISTRRLLPAFLAALIVSAALVPVSVAPVAATDGASFVTVVNRYRAEAGIGPVALNSVIDGVAVERSNQLAAARQIGHDFDWLMARLDQLNVCWQQLGEIVAYNMASPDQRIEKFVNQWYNSATHKAIMLGTGYTHAGGSWKMGSDGRNYGVMIFVKLCGATAPKLTVGGFTDIGDSAFKADILWLATEKITQGCDVDRFCPTAPVIRDQMASFLTRAMSLPGASRDYFSDDAADAHQASINSIAQAGVTQGCATAKYCPGSKVTRAQMATFLSRALSLPTTSTDFFWDDNSSPHEDAINRLAAAGVTTGCGDGRYCPSGTVTREQMAAFLHRAFD